MAKLVVLLLFVTVLTVVYVNCQVTDESGSEYSDEGEDAVARFVRQAPPPGKSEIKDTLAQVGQAALAGAGEILKTAEAGINAGIAAGMNAASNLGGKK